MPSGHSSFSLCFVCWSIYCYIRELEPNIKYPVVYSIAAVNVIFSRIYLGYHTVLQTIFGSLNGLLLSFIYFYAVDFYMKHKQNKENSISVEDIMNNQNEKLENDENDAIELSEDKCNND